MTKTLKINDILEQINEVLFLIENKTYLECYKLLQGHNFNDDFFDFNYKNLCLTLNNKLKFVGSVEIYDKNENLDSTESIGDILKLMKGVQK